MTAIWKFGLSCAEPFHLRAGLEDFDDVSRLKSDTTIRSVCGAIHPQGGDLRVPFFFRVSFSIYSVKGQKQAILRLLAQLHRPV
jgi:hypothetical protein